MTTWIVIGTIAVIIAVVLYMERRNEKKYQEERRREGERREKKLTPKVTKRHPSTPGTPAPTKPEIRHPKPTNDLYTSPNLDRGVKSPKSYELKSEPKIPTKSVSSTPSPTPSENLSKPSPKPRIRSQERPVSSTQTVKKAKSVTEPKVKREQPETVSKPSRKPQARPQEKSESALQRTEKTKPTTETNVRQKQPQVQKSQEDILLPKGEYPDFNYKRLIEMGLSEEEALEFIQELIPQIGDQIPLIDEAMKIPDFHKMERLTHSIKGSSTTIGTGGVSDLLVEYNTYLKTGTELPVAQAYQQHLKTYFEKLKKQFPPKEN